MSAFLSKLKSLLVPYADDADYQRSRSGALTRQDILDILLSHFKEQMAFETTRYSLLFHTAFVIYLRQDDYERISPGFQITAQDAVSMFLDCVHERMSKYPEYVPHSKFWTFQLVSIPEGTMIEGVSEEEMESRPVIIRSSIFPENEYDADDAGRIVTTLRTVNSMKAMPQAINVALLKGLDQLDKDKYRIRFASVQPVASESAATRNVPDYARGYARITADEGSFIEGDRTFTTYMMKCDELYLCGRNAVSQRGRVALLLDSDEVMNPHVVIRRNPDSGVFQIQAIGPIKLNERTVSPGGSKWLPLPDNSVFLINDDIQISFKTV